MNGMMMLKQTEATGAKYTENRKENGSSADGDDDDDVKENPFLRYLNAHRLAKEREVAHNTDELGGQHCDTGFIIGVGDSVSESMSISCLSYSSIRSEYFVV